MAPERAMTIPPSSAVMPAGLNLTTRLPCRFLTSNVRSMEASEAGGTLADAPPATAGGDCAARGAAMDALAGPTASMTRPAATAAAGLPRMGIVSPPEHGARSGLAVHAAYRAMSYI